MIGHALDTRRKLLSHAHQPGTRISHSTRQGWEIESGEHGSVFSGQWSVVNESRIVSFLESPNPESRIPNPQPPAPDDPAVNRQFWEEPGRFKTGPTPACWKTLASRRRTLGSGWLGGVSATVMPPTLRATGAADTTTQAVSPPSITRCSRRHVVKGTGREQAEESHRGRAPPAPKPLA